MTDLRECLRPLVDDAAAGAPPIAELQRRALRRRRQRSVGGGVAGAVVVLAAVLVLPGLREVWQPPPEVVLAPGGEGVGSAQVYEGDGVRFSYPGDWIVVADPPGPQVLVGTHRLSELDAVLALLTRHDTVFSDNLPDAGVFFAVGGDRLQPAYESRTRRRGTVERFEPRLWPYDQWSEDHQLPDQLPDGPVERFEIEIEDDPTVGPEARLGEPRRLSTEADDEVVARFGHVGRSTVSFAVYATGPGASEAVQAADEIVATLSYRAEAASTPPTGEPYFPHGQERTVAAAVDPVVAFEYDDVRLTLRVGSGCLLVSRVQQGSDQPLAGHCDLTTAGRSELASAFVEDLPVATPQPGDAAPAHPTLAAASVGDGITSAQLRTADGQTSSAAVHDGWLLGAAPGRIVQIIGYDSGGSVVTSITAP